MVTQQHQQNQGPPRSEVRGFNQERTAPVTAGHQPKNVAPIPVSVIESTYIKYISLLIFFTLDNWGNLIKIRFEYE